MKVCFLFGSGASVPAGKATVTQITEQVLSGDNPSPHVAKIDFYKHIDVRLKESRVKFLRWLEIQVKRRYAYEPNRPANYEDLYYLASQMYDDLRGEYDNPAVRPLIERAYLEVLPRVDCFAGKLEEEMKHLTNDVVDYIRRCVVLLLRADLQSLDYLDFVREAYQANLGEGLEILTLNHDTVVEDFLETRGIPFFDGFRTKLSAVQVRQWQPTELREAYGKIRVFKLHGGIDWFRFRPDEVQDWSEDYIGIPTPEYRLKSQRDERQRQHRILNDDLPVCLIGTFNKFPSYTDSVYLEIYYRAFCSLDEAGVLVIVGYGFGDKGINKLITDWIYRNSKRQIIVVDVDADNLWERARGAIGNKWHNWLDAKRLIPVTFDLQNKLSWREILRYLT